MVAEAASRLESFCRRRAGSSVRSVISYDSDGYRMAYLREDLRAAYSEDRMDEVVGIGREIHRIRRRSHTEDTPLGRPQAGVRTYENALVVQLPLGESAGLLATFDPEVGRDLVSFIHECHERVSDDG